MHNTTTIPKKIWFLWLQGEDQMKPMVRECYRSWQVLNPSWEVVVLTRENLTDYIPVDAYLNDERITMQALSDIVRIMLLRDHGGVWTDASGYCTRPLDEWVHDAVASGYFAPHTTRRDRVADNWIMASLPGSYIATAWAAEVERYFALGPIAPRRILWLFHRVIFRFWIKLEIYSVITKPFYFYKRCLGVYSYFWFMYIFAKLVERDPAFKAAWEAIPVMYAADGVVVINTGLLNTVTESVKRSIEDNPFGVHKLDVRLPLAEAADDSVIAYLLQRNKEKYNYA